MTTASASPSNRSSYGKSHWMMNSIVTGRAPIWHLFAKELMQLMPLFLSLLAVGGAVHGLAGMINGLYDLTHATETTIHGLATLVLPALFAIGVGPILISQEKEQKTLLWLSSIPISRKQIAITKLVISVAALILFWIFNILIGILFFGGILNPSMETTVFSGPVVRMYICNSIFLLFLSLVCGWLFETGWMAILMIALIAGVVAVSLFGIDYASTEVLGFEEGIASLVAFLIATVGLGFGSAGIGWDTARRTFIQPAPNLNTRSASQSTLNSVSVDPTIRWSTVAPFSSQMWYILRQNMILRLVLVVGAVLGSLCALLASFGHLHTLHSASTVVVLVTLLSWLGASVFASDNRNGRIRFLAERGLEPWTIWFSRMLLPAIFFTALLLFQKTMTWHPARLPSQDVPTFILGYPLILPIGVLIYSTTQWISQWMRSSLLVLCLAPVIGIATMMYSGVIIFAFRNTNLIMVSSVVLLMATRIMLRPWMDGRTGFSFSLTHIGLGVIAFSMPVFPIVLDWKADQVMSQDMEAHLDALGLNHSPLQANWVKLKFPEPTQSSDLNALDQLPFIDRVKEVDLILKDIESQFGRIQRGNIEYNVRSFLAGEFMLASATLSSLDADASNGGDRASADYIIEMEAVSSRYGKLVELLDLTVQIDRRANGLWQSEIADRTEKVLVEELSKTIAKKHLDNTKYSEISQRLADAHGRNISRRKAIVASWRESKTPAFNMLDNPFSVTEPITQNYGGFRLPEAQEKVPLFAYFRSNKQAKVAAEVLLRYLDSGNRRPGNPAFENYNSYWNIDSQILPEQVWPITENLLTPGLLWHREWEEEAKYLLKNLDEFKSGGIPNGS